MEPPDAGKPATRRGTERGGRCARVASCTRHANGADLAHCGALARDRDGVHAAVPLRMGKADSAHLLDVRMRGQQSLDL